MKIDIFKNYKSRYGVLGHFSEGLQRAFERANIASTIFENESEGEITARFVLNPPDFTLGFNFLMDDEIFYDPYKIPHCSIIVDWATYFTKLLQTFHTLACFTDADCCEFMKLFGFHHSFFLPHAIDRETIEATDPQKIREAKRDLEVVFIGSYIDGEGIYAKWKENLSQGLLKLLDDVIEETLASDELSHPFALLMALQKNPDEQEEIRNKGIPLFDLINSLDQVLRARDKVRLFSAIEDRHVHVFTAKEDHGRFKEALKGNKRAQFTFHDPVPFAELPQVLLRAKIVLNSMPMFKKSLHERIFSALCAGASVITNRNALVPRFFTDDKAVAYFLSPKYSDVNEMIEKMVATDEARVAATLAARDIVKEYHTWDQRVGEIERQMLLMEAKSI